MSKLQSLLAEVPVGINFGDHSGIRSATVKRADLESPDETQLEQDFGRLAYTFLQDRAPNLVPYLLGFEVVEREEDGSRAVGIFGFKIGGTYYYVPTFFMNSQIKGMDSLYSKRTNSFVPLKEGWINYIINRQTIELGQGSKSEEVQKDFERPNFDFLVRPPMSLMSGSKTAEDRSFDEVASDGFEVWNEMQTAMVEGLEKDAEFQRAWAGAIYRMDHRHDLPFEKTAEDSPLISYLQKHGGVPAVNLLMKTITENPGFAKAALTFYPNVDSLFVSEFDAELQPKKEAAKLSILTEVTEYLDGKDKRRLVRDGFTIHDTRDESEKSEAYDIDYERRFHSPTEAGIYDVLLRNGSATSCYVFMPVAGDKTSMSVIVDREGKNCFLAEQGAYFSRETADDAEAPDKGAAYAEAVPCDQMRIGRRYVLLDEHMCVVKPFEVKAIVSENEKRTIVKVRECYYREHKRPTYGHDFKHLHRNHSCDVPCDVGGDRQYLQLADHKGRITASGTDGCIVPSNWKALELASPRDNELDNYEAQQVKEDLFQPGTLVDMMDALEKTGVHHLTVASDDGLEYSVHFDKDFVDGQPVGYKSAFCKLVGKFGLSVDDAETMMKEASANFKSRRLIKLGQMVGVNMPNPSPQAFTQEPYTGIPMMQPQVENMTGSMTGVRPPQDSAVPGFNLGGEAQMDQEAAGLAEQAAGAGQKQVFDHAAIGGLAKLHDTTTVIDSYVPELVQALDRLGRILFLFYWKNEEFAERYGTEDLAEMEDSIRGVFKSFGDLVLQLRQKSIDADEAQSTVV